MESASDFLTSMPRRISYARSVAMKSPTIFTALAVTFAASMASMSLSAYSAANIQKSACGKTDENAKKAYENSRMVAVVSALLGVATAGAAVFMVMRTK